MKNKLLSKLLVAFIGTIFISAACISEESVTKRYIYTGNGQAMSVCKSIVQDNAVKLRAMLHFDQMRRHSTKSADVLYTCNNNNLYVFAVDMDAKRSQKQLLRMDRNRGFYKKGRVFIEDVAGL